MEVGDILCVKLTGEVVTVIDIEPINGSRVVVRRPVVSQENGISHETDYFFPYELETEEEHLRREAKSMVLKFTIQREMDKELEKLQAAEREENEKKGGVNPALLVN